MAEMTMDDLLGEGAEAAGLNKRAKLMRSMQAQAAKLRRMGMDAEDIDVLIRGQHGLLRPQDARRFESAMRKVAVMSRISAIPGITKALRGWPGNAQEDTSAMDALEGLGFGGGGQTMEDLLR